MTQVKRANMPVRSRMRTTKMETAVVKVLQPLVSPHSIQAYTTLTVVQLAVMQV